MEKRLTAELKSLKEEFDFIHIGKIEDAVSEANKIEREIK